MYNVENDLPEMAYDEILCVFYPMHVYMYHLGQPQHAPP